MMKLFLNYLGLYRLYSLVDLTLLLIAVKTNTNLFIGTIFLWLGFISYLENNHSHSYRAKIPKEIYIIFYILGIVFYRKIEAILFILASYFYTKKNKGYFGVGSPVFRGLQNFFLIGGIAGYNNKITLLALLLIFFRNLSADFRDIKKDLNENFKTIPIILGFKKDIKYIHILMLFITSFIWWSFTDLNIFYLFIIYLIQIFSYNLTVR